jgi:hypothetical protein
VAQRSFQTQVDAFAAGHVIPADDSTPQSLRFYSEGEVQSNPNFVAEEPAQLTYRPSPAEQIESLPATESGIAQARELVAAGWSAEAKAMTQEWATFMKSTYSVDCSTPEILNLLWKYVKANNKNPLDKKTFDDFRLFMIFDAKRWSKNLCTDAEYRAHTVSKLDLTTYEGQQTAKRIIAEGIQNQM